MTLRLVIEHATHPQPRRETLHKGGDLSIGRGAECDWTIEDPDMFVSRRHCVISVRDGQYLVTDASRGGLFIDGADRPLGAGNSATIGHGTRLRLGDVVIRVEIDGAPSAAAPVSRLNGALHADDFFARPVEAAPTPPRPSDLPEPFETGRPAAGVSAPPPRPAGPPAFDDPFTLDPVRSPAAPTPPAAPAAAPVDDFWAMPAPPAGAEVARPSTPSSDFTDAFATPASSQAAAAAAAPVADDWLSAPAKPDPAPDPPPRPQPIPPVSGPTPVATAAPVAVSDADPLAAFLRGAGLDPAQIDPTSGADLEALGRRFRLLAEGVVQLLRARAREKGSARLAQTVIGSTDVNPLKFLPITDEAIAALIAPRGRGYLPPEEAIIATFRDLSDHQMRSWLAIQAALRRMVDRFDPAAFEAEADAAGLMKALLAGGRGAQLWKLYGDRYQHIARSAEDKFLGEIGADFRDAYENKGRIRDD